MKEELKNVNEKYNNALIEQEEIISKYLDKHPSVFTDKIAENAETGEYFIIGKGENFDEIDSYYFAQAESVFDTCENIKVIGLTKDKKTKEILVYYLNDDWMVDTMPFYYILNVSYYNIINLLIDNDDWEIPCIEETEDEEEDY